MLTMLLKNSGDRFLRSRLGTGDMRNQLLLEPRPQGVDLPIEFF
jgi:hypothetical protein